MSQVNRKASVWREWVKSQKLVSVVRRNAELNLVRYVRMPTAELNAEDGEIMIER